MDSIIITPKNEKERSFIMEMLKKMRIKAELMNDEDMHRMTINEYREMANNAINAAREGRTTSQSELEKEMAQW